MASAGVGCGVDPIDDKDAGLTQLQANFCREYIVDFRLRDSAIRAGYSKKSAHTAATDLYKMPLVRKRIKELLQERRKEYDVTVERVQKELARIAFADPLQLIEEFTPGSTPNSIVVKNVEDIPKRLRAAVKGWKPTKEGLQITFYEKTPALEMLAKHFGYFEADNKQRVQEGPQIYLPDNSRGDQMPPTDDEKNDGPMPV